MKNIYHILRQAVLVLSVLSLAISGGALAQNNNWQQQRQHEQARQQQQQYQQQQEQARRQQEENRRQQDQMRQQQAQQQQQEQTRRQQEQARLQQQQYQQQQQQQQEQARRLQDENRRQAEASKRDLQAAQTRNEQEKQRQQLQNAQKAQMAGKPAPAGTPQTIANRASDRMVFSNGDAKLTRPLTPAEMKRGFTGKVTEDGRALVKFQNRLFAVPAARLGITPRDTSTSQAALATSWSPQKQSAINADIQKLASGTSSGPGTAAKGEPVKVASVQTQSRIDAARAARSGGQEPPAKKTEGGSVDAKGAGIVAKDGTKITGFTTHGVDRAIGDGAKRAGTTPDAILDAVKNPSKIKEGVDSQGRPFKVYTGDNARVVINPETGKVVSTNPLSREGAHLP